MRDNLTLKCGLNFESAEFDSDNFQSTRPYSHVGRIAVCSLLNKGLDSCSSFHPNLIGVLFLFYGNAYGTITKMD